MRPTLAGILLLAFTASALAQAEGDVESIGLGQFYRPTAWVPMKLRLRPRTGATETYKLQVIQEDWDGDHVSYTRPFTLNGNPEGRQIEEKVWVYFLPQPREFALEKIKIFLCNKNGRQLVEIKVPRSVGTLQDIDALRAVIGQGGLNDRRATRMVLVVSSAAGRTPRDLYVYAHGINENVEFVRVNATELPGNVLGYQMIDAILWVDTDPAQVNSDAMAAIEEYVRDGGRLVVLHNSEWQRLKQSTLGPMLPIVPTGTADERGLLSLRKLAGVPSGIVLRDKLARGRGTLSSVEREFLDPSDRPVDPWYDLDGDRFPIATSTPRPGAFVDLYCDGSASSPYLARWNLGLGTVTWIAQDLCDRNLLSNSEYKFIGWPRVWDCVFDWPNRTITGDAKVPGTELALQKQRLPNRKRDRQFTVDYCDARDQADPSIAIRSRMEFPNKQVALVFLAIMFFLAYWAVAGPGSFLYLRTRGRANYAWMGFAVCALVATAATAGVVKLVLRGDPEIRHATFLRISADGQEAVAYSQFGLYIPRDGLQKLELKQTTPKRTTYIAPYPVGRDTSLGEAGAYQEYEVPVHERSSTDPVAIQVPYRSTLKRFHAKWVGRPTGSIVGKPALGAMGWPDGILANETGHDLHWVYLVYRPSGLNPDDIARGDDIVYLLSDGEDGAPAWRAGTKLDLGKILNGANFSAPGQRSIYRDKDKLGLRDYMNSTWTNKLWHSSLRSLSEGKTAPLSADGEAFIVSFFDRIYPDVRLPDNMLPNLPGAGAGPRFEFRRQFGRLFDISNAVSAGNLVILARAESESLPFPLEVEGKPVKGQGPVYYQVILPIERTGPATQPSGQSTR